MWLFFYAFEEESNKKAKNIAKSLVIKKIFYIFAT